MRARRPLRVGSSAIMILVLTAVLMGSSVYATPAHAAGIVVNTDTDKAGLFAADGLCGLREAIEAANNDSTAATGDCTAGSGTDTITFASNYAITLSLGELDITSPIIIQGNGTGNTILQPNGSPNTASWRVFYVGSGGNLTLRDLNVRNGVCTGSCATSTSAGGGIYNDRGTLAVTNSLVSENLASAGGGIYNNFGTVSVTNATFSLNSATSGGGILNSFGGTLTVIGSTLNNNGATDGGGITDGGSMTVAIVHS